MGNLGRATWQETTNGLWPWSFDQCVEEESPNVAAAQSINACNDKPNFGLHPHQGRGAPEIDIFEAMATEAFSGMTQSLQVAPALPKTFRPNIGQTPAKGMWYDGIEFSNGAVNNDAYYGPEGADAVSANIGTDVSFYSTFHTFRVEWELGEEGYIRWFVDDKKFFEIPASALSKQYGDLPGRRIPEEPMYLILNTAVSSNWSPVCGKQWDASQQCPPGSTKECCRIFPAEYQVDSVRIYQSKEMGHRLGCSPKEFPTAEYIQAHAKMYDAEDISTFPSINGREKLLRDTLASIMCLMLIATIVYHSAAHCRQKYKRWAYVPIDHSSHSEACTGSAYAGGGGRRSGGSDREQSAVLVGLEEGGTDVSVRHRQGHEHLNLYGLPQYRGVEIDWQLASEHKIN